MAKLEELTIDEMLQRVIDKGYTFSLQTDKNDSYSFAVCRPEWVTDDLYQAKTLPQALGDTPRNAVLNLLRGKQIAT